MQLTIYTTDTVNVYVHRIMCLYEFIFIFISIVILISECRSLHTTFCVNNLIGEFLQTAISAISEHYMWLE